MIKMYLVGSIVCVVCGWLPPGKDAVSLCLVFWNVDMVVSHLTYPDGQT